MHPLGDAVALRVIWGGVVEGDLVSSAELLELTAGKLCCIVQHYTTWSPVISHVLQQMFKDVCCV